MLSSWASTLAILPAGGRRKVTGGQLKGDWPARYLQTNVKASTPFSLGPSFYELSNMHEERCVAFCRVLFWVGFKGNQREAELTFGSTMMRKVSFWASTQKRPAWYLRNPPWFAAPNHPGAYLGPSTPNRFQQFAKKTY